MFAVFMAFDPWYTCWRLPPGAFRYFDAAQKEGLISDDEAIFLSHMLLRQAADLLQSYNGRFAHFFKNSQVKTLLTNVHDLQYLARTGLDISGSWLDRLYETCLWPLQPKNHLNIKSFFDLTPKNIIDPYLATPWLAWIESLDVACVGPSLGLKMEEIVSIIQSLNNKSPYNKSIISSTKERKLAKKIAIPLFSFGLQGIVFAFHHDIPEENEGFVLSALMQFGQTLADEYSVLRARTFQQNFSHDKTERQIAREMVTLLSPINKIIVRKAGRPAGYRLVLEHDYWGGYDELTPREIENSTSDRGFSLEISRDISVYIEPISDETYFDEEFSRMRLRSCFDYVNIRSDPPEYVVLPLHEVQQLCSDLKSHASLNGGSIAKLRQLYIASKVEEHWIGGKVKITNAQVRDFLQTQLRKSVKTGYQISSFGSDVERLFMGKVAVAKTRNGLTLSWNDAG